MDYIINIFGLNGERNFARHTHKNIEIIYYLEGDGFLSTEKGDLPFSKGSIAIVPPGTSHGSVSTRGMKLITIESSFSNFLNFSEPLMLMDNASRDAEALVRIIYRNRNNAEEYLSALVDAFLRFLMQNMKVENNLTRAVRKIADQLSEHFYQADLSPSALLQESGYAEDYIRAHFKKIYDKTPHKYLNELRIAHARYLIDNYQETLLLSEIAERCGFIDYVTFYQKFKSLVGCSPRKYKKVQDEN